MRFKLLVILLSFGVNIYAETNINISHTPIALFSYPGKSIRFRAVLQTNNCSIASVKFLYRATGEEYFFTNSMTTNESASNYIFILTNQSLTKQNIDYFILVKDNYANLYREPVKSEGYYTVRISSKAAGDINSADGGQVILSDDIPEDDKKTALVVPSDAVFGNNTFGIEFFSSDVIDTVLKNDNQIVADNEFIDNNMTPVAMYDFYLDNNGAKEKFVFRKKITVYLRYFDEDNNGIVDDTSYNENKLKVFYWDNVQWRYIESELDTVNNVLKISTEHLNRFAVFYVDKDISELNKKSEILDYVANSSFSPLDGEIVLFGLKNDIADYNITIYNFKGKVIRTLSIAGWDGRDENGNIVDSGVYLYKITVGDKSITGMVNVIK